MKSSITTSNCVTQDIKKNMSAKAMLALRTDIRFASAGMESTTGATIMKSRIGPAPVCAKKSNLILQMKFNSNKCKILHICM